jgi:bacterioferritin
MKGNDQVLAKLNSDLSDELTAVSQYMVQAEMCDNWGYKKLASVIEKRAIDEMKHAEKLIGRILFLEGVPVVSNLGVMHIGESVETQHKFDRESEIIAIKAYNESLKLTADLGDNGTHDLLQNILNDEEAHLDWIEAQIDQIKQMGIQVYLAEQL